MDLAIETVSKAFPGVQALDAVSFDLKAGEIHALMGENGAGKSTLIKIMTGAYRKDGGTITLEGQPVAFDTPADAQAAGVIAVHQEVAIESCFTGVPRRSMARSASEPTIITRTNS